MSSTTSFILPVLGTLLLIARVAFGDATPPAPASSTVSCDRFSKTGFWDVDIDNKPALAPECGPPLSLHADRNLKHLPAQIAGLVAAYLLVASVVGTAILSIRRKRNRQFTPKAVELKLVSSVNKFEPGSPNSFYSWMRNPLRRKGPGSSAGESLAAARSPGIDSITSFDQKTVEMDRMSRQQEMERLYAAAIAHDEARRSQAQLSLKHESVTSSKSNKPVDKRLTRINNLDIPQSPISPSAYGPQSPRSPVRAIYPPDHELPLNTVPLSPTSPIRAKVPEEMWPTQQPQYPYMQQKSLQPNVLSPTTPMTPMSPTGQVYLPNDMYPASPPPGQRRMRLPNQKSPTGTVLSPMMSASLMSPPLQQSARTPLPNDMYPGSPVYAEFPQSARPPPLPAGRVGLPDRPGSISSMASRGRKALSTMRINTSGSARGPDSDSNSDELAPLSATFESEQDMRARESPTPTTAGTQESSAESAAESSLFSALQAQSSANGARRAAPTLNLKSSFHKVAPGSSGASGNPSRNSSTTTLPSNPAAFKSTPSPPPLPPPPNTKPAVPVNNLLPLRAQFPDQALKSPGPMKTTVLEQRRDAFTRGPRTARTPMTGAIPQTPYSAYMPFTPVTPITPHLVTRKERKERQKAEAKSKRTLLDDSDMVKEEDENWD